MSSITKKTKQGVQPLAADDGILADSTSDGELSGVSEGDGPLRHAEEAKHSMTFSGDGPENLRDSYMNIFTPYINTYTAFSSHHSNCTGVQK